MEAHYAQMSRTVLFCCFTLKQREQLCPTRDKEWDSKTESWSKGLVELDVGRVDGEGKSCQC